MLVTLSCPSVHSQLLRWLQHGGRVIGYATWGQRERILSHIALLPLLKWAIRKLMHYFTCTKSFKHPLILKVYPRVWAVEEKFCSHQAEFSRNEDLHSFWVTINLNRPSNALKYDSITILKIRAFLNKHIHTLCRLFKIKK